MCHHNERNRRARTKRVLTVLWCVLWLSTTAALAETATLTWNAPVGGAIVRGYAVHRVDQPCSGSINWAASPTISSGVTTTQYIDASVPSTVTEACWNVRAYNNAGYSPFNGMAGKVFLVQNPDPPLAPPTHFRYEQGAFTWTATPGAAGYLLRVQETGQGPGCTATALYCNAFPNLITGTRLALALPAGKTFYAWIHSVNALGVYGPSVEITGVSGAPPPPPPTPPAPTIRIMLSSVVTVEKLTIDVKKVDCPGGSTSTSRTFNSTGTEVPASDPTWATKTYDITCRP